MNMEQFRIYLKSELGKLRNDGDAAEFLSKVSLELITACGIPGDLANILQAFESQEKVNQCVDSLADADLKSLTCACDEQWRKNGVFRMLDTLSAWKTEKIPVERIDVRTAEGTNKDIFERHGYRLVGIVGDDELWKRKPYVGYSLNEKIAFPTLLGCQRQAGRIKIFDGIHRAILMAKCGA